MGSVVPGAGLLLPAEAPDSVAAAGVVDEAAADDVELVAEAVCVEDTVLAVEPHAAPPTVIAAPASGASTLMSDRRFAARRLRCRVLLTCSSPVP